MRFRCRLEPGELKQEEDVNVDEVRSHARRKSGTFCIMMCIGMALSIPASHAESIWPPLDTPPVPLDEGPVDLETNRLLSGLLEDVSVAQPAVRTEKLKTTLRERLMVPVTEKPFPPTENAWVPFESALKRLAPSKTGRRAD